MDLISAIQPGNHPFLRREKVMDMDTKNTIEKKPYHPPELIHYGDVIEITRSGNPGINDIAPGSIIEG